MKRFLNLLPFVLSLFTTIIILMVFAATGEAQVAVLIPFALVILLVTHDKLHE